VRNARALYVYSHITSISVISFYSYFQPVVFRVWLYSWCQMGVEMPDFNIDPITLIFCPLDDCCLFAPVKYSLRNCIHYIGLYSIDQHHLYTLVAVSARNVGALQPNVFRWILGINLHLFDCMCLFSVKRVFPRYICNAYCKLCPSSLNKSSVVCSNSSVGTQKEVLGPGTLQLTPLAAILVDSISYYEPSGGSGGRLLSNAEICPPICP